MTVAAPPAPEAPAQPDPVGVPVHRTVIEPPKGWQIIDWRELWKYRDLILNLIQRDVKVRYKQTVLGAAWAILQPAMMMMIFTILFGRVAKLPTGGIPAPLFYLTGLLPWMFFAAALGAASNSVLTAGALITKVYFPRQIVPLAATGAPMVDFLVSCLLLVIVCAYYGVVPSGQIIYAPIFIGIVALFAIGMGTGIAGLNVLFRDFRYVIPFAIQLGMYATPTIYLDPASVESETLQWMLRLNPIAGLITAFRASVLGGEIPWLSVITAAAVALVTFVIGTLYFRKVEDQFADVI